MSGLQMLCDAFMNKLLYNYFKYDLQVETDFVLREL